MNQVEYEKFFDHIVLQMDPTNAKFLLTPGGLDYGKKRFEYVEKILFKYIDVMDIFEQEKDLKEVEKLQKQSLRLLEEYMVLAKDLEMAEKILSF